MTMNLLQRKTKDIQYISINHWSLRVLCSE